MDDTYRVRIDDLKRFATALGIGVGLDPAQATAMASHVLWFDAAGAPAFGIETWPGWLRQVSDAVFDPRARPIVSHERGSTAVLEWPRGLPPLVLSAAAEIAVAKARDWGVGLMCVKGLEESGPVAAVAADIAMGPMAGALWGPGPAVAVAMPMAAGLPVVYDSRLAIGMSATVAGIPWPIRSHPSEWLIQAIAVTAFEPLTTWQERMAAADVPSDAPGLLRPDRWETSRRLAREHGVIVAAETWIKLREWAERLQVALPAPLDSR